jgi:uncharacterized protein YqeY
MLKDKLKKDSVEALKSGDKFRVGVLRFLISLIDKKELSLPPGSLKEEDEIQVLKKELKNKEESVKMFQDAGRKDLYEPLFAEIEIVKQYLPKEMSEEEVGKIVDEVLGELGETDFGGAMREVMKKVAGRAGGEVVSKLVREKLR